MSDELYRPFDDIVVERTDELLDLLSDRRVRKIWRNVAPQRPRVREGAIPLGKGETAPQPDITVNHLRDLRSELTGSAVEATQAGNGTRAFKLRQAAGNLDSYLETVVPEFRAANRGYAQSAAVVNSFAAGAKASQRRVHGPALVKLMQETVESGGELGDEALQAFRHGALDDAVSAITKVDDVTPGTISRRVQGRLQPGTVLREIFENADELEEMVERLYLEDRFTLMKNLRIKARLTIDDTNDMVSAMQNAQVQGAAAAFLRALNTADPKIARQMSNVIVDILGSSGATAQARMAEVMSKPLYQEFFRGLQATQRAAALQVGTGASRLAGPVGEAVSTLVERFTSRADATRTRQ